MVYVAFVLIVGVFSLLLAAFLIKDIMNRTPGTEKMVEISNMISEGSQVYLKRQFTVIAPLSVLLAVSLALALNLFEAFSYVIGVACSGLAGYIGMYSATRTNVRTAHAARSSLENAFKISIRGGMVTGISVTGLGLLGVTSLYLLSGEPNKLTGFALGIAVIALFMRVGGGIFTKAADIGADLVGKVEDDIPEDDPRNPGVIADQVGDNVGDVAGMSSDVFESYVCAIFPAMLMGVSYGVKGVLFPLVVPAVGILSSILTLLFLQAEDKNFGSYFIKALFASSIPIIIASYALSWQLFNNLSIFYATILGVLTGLAFGLITRYYTLYEYAPTQAIARASQTGPATTILTGFAYGLESTALPIIVVCVAIFLAYELVGVYGVALAAVGFSSLMPLVLAMDAFGPIVDNANGIIEMSGAGRDAKRNTDVLDAVGNTTKAICKGFAVGAAALSAIALFAAFIETAGIGVISIVDSRVIIGLLLGGMLSFAFSSHIMHAVGNAAFIMVNEIRRQFREIPGLREGDSNPDYSACIGISTDAALKGLVVPSLIAVMVPMLVGLFFGVETVGGLYIGLILSAFPLALLLAHSGTAWDNAKKYVEAGFFGGRGSEAHKAAVIGDTIGDPFKDTVGPSLDILMDIVGIIAILFTSLFLTYSLF